MVKEEGHQVNKEIETALMLPHLWVLTAHENNLLEAITCTGEKLAVFWKSQMNSPQMTPELEKMIQDATPNQLPIPYVLHGDGAPFTEVDSVQVLSFRCLLSRRSVSECQLLITAVPKLAMTKSTFKKVMETVAWSWQALFTGVCPKEDLQGPTGERGSEKEYAGASLEIWSGIVKNLGFFGLHPTWCAHTAMLTRRKRIPSTPTQTSGLQLLGEKQSSQEMSSRPSLQATLCGKPQQ